MKNIVMVFAIIMSGCSYANLDDVKSVVCERWRQVGYECIGYEGFQWGFWIGGDTVERMSGIR